MLFLYNKIRCQVKSLLDIWSQVFWEYTNEKQKRNESRRKPRIAWRHFRLFDESTQDKVKHTFNVNVTFFFSGLREKSKWMRQASRALHVFSVLISTNTFFILFYFPQSSLVWRDAFIELEESDKCVENNRVDESTTTQRERANAFNGIGCCD